VPTDQRLRPSYPQGGSGVSPLLNRRDAAFTLHLASTIGSWLLRLVNHDAAARNGLQLGRVEISGLAVPFVSSPGFGRASLR